MRASGTFLFAQEKRTVPKGFYRGGGRSVKRILWGEEFLGLLRLVQI
jgi:hypothetical protein